MVAFSSSVSLEAEEKFVLFAVMLVSFQTELGLLMLVAFAPTSVPLVAFTSTSGCKVVVFTFSVLFVLLLALDALPAPPPPMSGKPLAFVVLSMEELLSELFPAATVTVVVAVLLTIPPPPRNEVVSLCNVVDVEYPAVVVVADSWRDDRKLDVDDEEDVAAVEVVEFISGRSSGAASSRGFASSREPDMAIISILTASMLMTPRTTARITAGLR
mmetsp:Transcript_70486/g.168813  ORF Transcript_70486/g.168813 Transcript_70486/m.168813 type:complete len:215 (+) Transcript_70486:627-1271(+)